MDPRQVYVEHLDVINRIAESLCRRNGVRGADAEDFAADVRLKLLQDDYAVLRKHRGQSSITTFLTVVISNQFRDFRIKTWGKWRPSAEAKRRGAIAIHLESLIYRDGLTFQQACDTILRDPKHTVDRATLRAIFASLPYRVHRRLDDGAAIDDMESADRTDADLLNHERDHRLEAAKAALGQAVDRLPPDDRIMIRLHFFEGLSVADMARAGGVPQKPLYARLRRLLDTLSRDMVSHGFTRDEIGWISSPPS